MIHEILTLPLQTPEYDPRELFSRENTVLLSQFASNPVDTIDKCLNIQEMYSCVRLLLPGLSIGRITTLRTLSKACHAYAGVKWDSSRPCTLEDLVYLIDQKWMESEMTDQTVFKMLPEKDERNDVKPMVQEINGIFANIISNSKKVNVSHLNLLLDCLLSVHYKTKFELIQLVINSIIDTAYLSSELRNRQSILMFIFRIILNDLGISSTVVFNKLDTYFKIPKLSKIIWNSRSHLFDVVYGLFGSQNNEKLLQNMGKLQIHVDICPQIPFKVMRPFKVERSRKDKFVISKSQFNQMFEKISFKPTKDEVPNFLLPSDTAAYELYNQVIKSLKTKQEGLCIEEKLDGERCQLHLFRDQPGCSCPVCQRARSTLSLDDGIGVLRCLFYSRIRNVQLFYGAFIGDPLGTITRTLKHVHFDHIENAILDGEMVAMDSKGILGFAMVKAVAASEHLQLRENGPTTGIILSNGTFTSYHMFDLLFVNNKTLQYSPLCYRKEILEKTLSYRYNGDSTVQENPSLKLNRHFRIHSFKNITNRSSLMQLFNRMIKSEGLVLKCWSLHKWIKIKKEYLGQGRQKLDVVIMGMINGQHNQGGFLIGVKDPEDILVCIGKLNYVSAMGLLNLYEFDQSFTKVDVNIDKLKSLLTPTSNIPVKYKFGKIKPDIYCLPEIVIEVSCQIEVENPNVKFKYGHSKRLKDVRFRYIREDKELDDIDTIDDINRMSKDESDLAIKDYYSSSDDDISTDDDMIIQKKRRKLPKDELRLNNKSFYSPGNKHNILADEGEIFKDKTLIIYGDGKVYDDICRQSKVTQMIKQNQGKVIYQLPQGMKLDDLIIISDNLTFLDKRIKTLIELGDQINVLNYQWVQDCIYSKQLVSPDETHLTLATKEMKFQAKINRDFNGFNKTNKITIWGLEKMYQYWSKLNANNYMKIGNNNLNQWPSLTSCTPLYNKKVYVLSREGFELEKMETELRVRFSWGEIQETLDSDDTDIIMPIGFLASEIDQLKSHLLDNGISTDILTNLVEKDVEMTTDAKYYIICSDTAKHEEIKDAFKINGIDLVESWENANFILPVGLSGADVDQLKAVAIGKQFAAWEDIVPFLES